MKKQQINLGRLTRKPEGKICCAILIALIIIAVIVFLFGVSASKSSKKISTNSQVSYTNKLITATVLPNPREISPFQLTDNKGQPFTNENLKNHWTFFFFGFTSCGHICPMTMAELQRVYKILLQEKIQIPQFVLVSVDPERDSVEKLNAFVTSFNKAFIGLRTGDRQALDRLTHEFGVVYMKVMPNATANNKNDFDIDHSGTLILINPEGKLSAFFSMPHKAKNIAKDFITIQSHYK